MPDPAAITHWIDRKIWSANTWLEDHGRTAKRPRPDLDISHHEEDLEMLQYMRGCFQKAVDRRAEQGAAQ